MKMKIKTKTNGRVINYGYKTTNRLSYVSKDKLAHWIELTSADIHLLYG